jgi:hypothetical protein
MKALAQDLIILPRSLRAPAKSSTNHTKMAPTTPPGINPLLQVLWMES